VIVLASKPTVQKPSGCYSKPREAPETKIIHGN